MHRPHPAATVHKAHRVLKARAMVAVKVAVMATAKAVEDKSSAAIRALTTVVTVKVVPHREAHARKVVARAVVVKAAATKTVAVTMATNCHATSTRSKPRSLPVWICPTASPCAPAASLTRPAPASTAWPAVAAAMAAAVVVEATAVATVVAMAAEAVASVADQHPAP
jgi:hypothetical protein